MTGKSMKHEEGRERKGDEKEAEFTDKRRGSQGRKGESEVKRRRNGSSPF